MTRQGRLLKIRTQTGRVFEQGAEARQLEKITQRRASFVWAFSVMKKVGGVARIEEKKNPYKIYA
jgi:hypothetical protein